MAPPTIAVFGSLGIDLSAYVPHHPAAGETLTSTSFVVSPGGKGANQAVACAKLARDRPRDDSPPPAVVVRMVGAVGSDDHGQTLISNLSRHGVDTSAVRVLADTKTGIALIIVDDASGENRIVLSPEANHSPVLDTADPLESKPDLLVMQLEIPPARVLSQLRAARQAGVPVLLNPAPAVPLPDEAFEGLAHLVLNETEVALLTSTNAEEVGSADEEGLRRVAAVLVDKGVKTVVVTLGARGAYFLTATGAQGLVAGVKANVVDTTAAGDTFVGQYALEVVSAAASEESFNIAAAIAKANRAAAKAVEKRGAQASIPWRDEV
jgi:ribokinase